MFGRWLKAETTVKRGDSSVLGIDQQQADTKPCAQFKAAIHGVAQQQSAKSSALTLPGDSKPTDAHRRNGIARQPFAVGRLQIVQLKLRGRQAAIAENTCRVGVVNQNVGGGDAIALMLAGLRT